MGASQPRFDLQRIIEHVSQRSAMYAGEASFKSIAIWLDGFVAGLNSAAEVGSRVSELERFRDWLAKKFHASHGIERNLVWWGYFIRVYPNDEEALKQLPLLFAEFCEEIAKSQSR